MLSWKVNWPGRGLKPNRQTANNPTRGRVNRGWLKPNSVFRFLVLAFVVAALFSAGANSAWAQTVDTTKLQQAATSIVNFLKTICTIAYAVYMAWGFTQYQSGGVWEQNKSRGIATMTSATIGELGIFFLLGPIVDYIIQLVGGTGTNG